MIYLYELKDADYALKLIRRGIDDPKATDKQVLYMAAANLLPITKSSKLKNEISELFCKQDKFSLDSYVTFHLKSKQSWIIHY